MFKYFWIGCGCVLCREWMYLPRRDKKRMLDWLSKIKAKAILCLGNKEHWRRLPRLFYWSASIASALGFPEPENRLTGFLVRTGKPALRFWLTGFTIITNFGQFLPKFQTFWLFFATFSKFQVIFRQIFELLGYFAQNFRNFGYFLPKSWNFRQNSWNLLPIFKEIKKSVKNRLTDFKQNWEPENRLWDFPFFWEL